MLKIWKGSLLNSETHGISAKHLRGRLFSRPFLVHLEGSGVQTRAWIPPPPQCGHPPPDHAAQYAKRTYSLTHWPIGVVYMHRVCGVLYLSGVLWSDDLNMVSLGLTSWVMLCAVVLHTQMDEHWGVTERELQWWMCACFFFAARLHVYSPLKIAHYSSGSSCSFKHLVMIIVQNLKCLLLIT